MMALQVLEAVPQTWSIGSISKFLKRAVRNSLHMQRMAQIEENLARYGPIEHTHHSHRLVL